MNHETLVANIVQLIANESAVPATMIKMETNFQQDLGMNIDQLTHLRAMIRSLFGLKQERGNTDRIETVGDLIHHLEKRISTS